MSERKHISITLTTGHYIKSAWDNEAKVYYADTNIDGFNVEAETLYKFVELLPMAMWKLGVCEQGPSAPNAE